MKHNNGNKTFLYLAIPFALLLLVLAQIALTQIKSKAEQDTKNALIGVAQTTEKAVTIWHDDKIRELEHIADRQFVKASAEQLLEAEQQGMSLVEHPVQLMLREYIADNFPRLSMGYFLIGPNQLSLASKRNVNIGSINVIAKQRPSLLAKVLTGQSTFIPPLQPELSQSELNYRAATAFFAVPVRNNSKDVIAVLTMRIDPYTEFSRIIQTARIGRSGETYAFDDKARLITESRFIKQLRQSGILTATQSSILNISLYNKNNQLNVMASSALRQETGVNVQGYPDYRQETVVGTWRWLEQMNLGIATEIDYSEAFENYQYVQNVVYILLLALFLLFVVSVQLGVRRSIKTQAMLEQAKQKLEQDVTTQTQELIAEKQNFVGLFQSSRDAIVLIDNNVIIDGNRAAIELFGLTKIEQLKLASILDFSPQFQPLGDSSEQLYKTYIERALAQEKFLFEWTHTNNLGEAIPCDVWLQPTLWLGRSVIQASIRNISVRKLAEQKVIDAQRKLLKLLEATPDPILVVNKQGFISQTNQAVTRVFGYKSEELVGQTVEMLIPAEFRPGHDKKLDGYMAAPIRKDLAERKGLDAITKEGKRLTVEINLSPIQIEDETLVVAGIRDITQQKIAEQQSIQAKKIADEANQAKSDFLANMSHEIRTPMNAIIGMSHLALQTELNKKQRNYVEKVHRSAESLLGIINDILDFSKIEAGKLDIEQVPFHLDDVMENLANLVGLKAEEKGLELHFDIDDSVPKHLLGDPLRLGQVLINLGNNAVKFTHIGGEVVIRIRQQQESGDKVRLLFSVCDSGIGMSSDQMSRLFQSFSQADSSTTRKYGGTGLGLTISKKLTQLMDGEIWVDSEIDKGSDFHFTAQFGVLEHEERPTTHAQIELGPLNVLVVDDNSTARDILAQMLESLGFVVTTAKSGNDALQRLSDTKSSPFELVLMDWKMPVKDGLQTVSELQNQTQWYQPTVIMVTAYGREDISQAAGNLDIGGVLTKPVTSSSLLDAILLALGKEVVTGRRNNLGVQQSQYAIKKLHGAKVLLVEDNLLNQELALELLSSNGIIVTVAENGQEALDKLALEPFDGILMDCQMPIMDGYTATKKIRQQAVYKDLPIIAMTANAMAGDKEKVLTAGMNDHIAKPTNVSNMFNTMAAWIVPADPMMIEGTEVKPDSIDIPDLVTINKKAGLATTQNNSQLYAKLLRRFIQSYRDYPQDFQQHIDSNETDAPARWAHSLKGAAGNIGAFSIQENAKLLEEQITAGDDITLAFEQLASQLDKTLEELSTVNLNASKPENKNQYNELVVNAQLKHLSQLIEDYDTEASDVAEKIFDELKGSEHQALMSKLISAVNNYDFDTALEYVEQVQLVISKS